MKAMIGAEASTSSSIFASERNTPSLSFGIIRRRARYVIPPSRRCGRRAIPSFGTRCDDENENDDGPHTTLSLT